MDLHLKSVMSFLDHQVLFYFQLIQLYFPKIICQHFLLIFFISDLFSKHSFLIGSIFFACISTLYFTPSKMLLNPFMLFSISTYLICVSVSARSSEPSRREITFISAWTSSSFESLFSIFCTLLSTLVTTLRIKFRRYVTSLDYFPWSTIFLLSLSNFAVSSSDRGFFFYLLINMIGQVGVSYAYEYSNLQSPI